MSVTAKQVQDLRKMSGAGMMDCKTALAENNADIDLAFQWLREKGIAKAQKKSTRDANEGLVSIICLLYTSPSPRDVEESRMPSSA